MKPKMLLVWTAFVVTLFAAMPVVAFAEEPLLPAVDQGSFEGDWEGAWSDRSGRLFVALVSFKRKGVSTVTISSGAVRPFVTTFKISEALFQGGTVKIEADGIGEDVGHHLTLKGEGWAVVEIGLVKLAIEKRANAGRVLSTYDTVLYKAPRGFFENATRLLQFARSRLGKVR
jgi:hypothetical protein